MIKKLVSFSENNVAYLQSISEKKGIPVSEVVRRIIDEHQEKQSEQPSGKAKKKKEEVSVVPKCTLMLGKQMYAELVWRERGGVSITESKRAAADGFAKSFHKDKVTGLDPRTMDLKEINPNQDKYSLYLWCSAWVQKYRRQGDKTSDLIAEGIDFSEVLPPPIPGVVY